MIRRRFLAAAVPFSLIGVPALAETVDPRFPSTITTRIGGNPVRLALTGSAMRKKYGFSVYAVASYVQEGVKVRNAEALARADIPKILHLIFERQVDGPTIASSFRASIGAIHPAPAFSAELTKLERYFLPQNLRQGDHVWLTHVAGVGMACQSGNQPGVVIPGVPFAQAAWGTYLGPVNLGVALKEGLTSRLR